MERSDGAQVITADADRWFFGYGSLTWKVNFPCPVAESRNGYIRGFKRRFWQGSEDHRGFPGAPGRVVTVVKGEEGDRVLGVAYKVAKEHVEEVVDYLDVREKGGYSCERLHFHPYRAGAEGEGERKDEADEDEKIEVFMYRGLTDNPVFLGDAPLEDIAKQIAFSHGPSGDNPTYLFNLAQAMR